MSLRISSLLWVSLISSGERDWDFFMPYIRPRTGFDELLYPPINNPDYCKSTGSLLVLLYLWDEQSEFSKPPYPVPTISRYLKRDEGYRYHVPVLLREMKALDPVGRKEFLLSSLWAAVAAVLEKAKDKISPSELKQITEDFGEFAESYRALPLPSAK